MKDYDLEVLTLLANIINYLIFVFISLSLIGSQCFSRLHILLTIAGLIASIGVQLISIIIKKY